MVFCAFKCKKLWAMPLKPHIYSRLPIAQVCNKPRAKYLSDFGMWESVSKTIKIMSLFIFPMF